MTSVLSASVSSGWVPAWVSSATLKSPAKSRKSCAEMPMPAWASFMLMPL